MANRQTGIGLLFRRDEEQAIAELLEVLERNEGNMTRAAHDLCITRRHLYRLLNRANLWSDVERIRREAKQEPDWLTKTREAI